MVKKRTDFEYRLKRRAAKVSDFVRCEQLDHPIEGTWWREMAPLSKRGRGCCVVYAGHGRAS